MNNLYGPEERELVQRAIGEMAGELTGDKLKLTEYLRLLQLSDELDKDKGAVRTMAGWVSECRHSSCRTDE